MEIRADMTLICFTSTLAIIRFFAVLNFLAMNASKAEAKGSSIKAADQSQ